MSFRAGSFNRDLVLGLVRPFCPAHAVHDLRDVNLQGLANRGKKLLLVDVDNTLVKWRTEDFAQETIDWLEEAKSLGFEICIISNTRNQARLERLKKKLGISAMRGRFKPSRKMYHAALEHFNVKPSEAIMLGDQLFTDIFGANRAGIEAIWLQPISNVDFAPTKINRFGERLLRSYLYRSLHEPPDDEPENPEVAAALPIWERKVIRQFVKFCIVGGTSFVIDYCVTFSVLYLPFKGQQAGFVLGHWLMANLPLLFGGYESEVKAAMPIAGVFGASVAMLNSFYWNRLWTWKIRDGAERLAQFRRFVLVSLIGLGLNVVFRSLFFHLMPDDSKGSARIAFVLSAVIVAFWNFTGQRVYAFRNREK